MPRFANPRPPSRSATGIVYGNMGCTETSFLPGHFARSARLPPPVARQDGITAIPLGVARGNHGTSHPFDPRTAPQGSRGIAMMRAAPGDPRGIRSILVAEGLRVGRKCHTGAAFGES